MGRTLTLSGPGCVRVPGPNSKSIHAIEIEFGRLVENSKKINLV